MGQTKKPTDREDPTLCCLGWDRSRQKLRFVFSHEILTCRIESSKNDRFPFDTAVLVRVDTRDFRSVGRHFRMSDSLLGVDDQPNGT